MTDYRYIHDTNVTASYGLAADEFLMKYHEKQIEYPATLRLYNYKNYSVLAGRFQNINAEIDLEACIKNGYEYGRRLTGGGAILMGSDQLGICFATSSTQFKWENIRELYHKFSKPIINALASIGIDAIFRSKNDLEVNGKKIAGLGVHVSAEGTIQFHCSLLVDLNIEDMLKVLKIPIQKYSDKRKINSVKQRITTISRELKRIVSMQEIINLVRDSYAKELEAEFVNKSFNQEEEKQIKLLEKERYLNEEWIFQRSPQSDMTGMSIKKTPAGLLRTYIGLKGETIKSVLITGDFFEQVNLFTKIESELKWSALDLKSIENKIVQIFESGEFDKIKQKLEPKMIVNSVWLAAQRAMAAERYNYRGSCYYPKNEKNKLVLIQK